jgi:ATP-dependent Clp protease ATP-binding subunit ClpB
LKAELEGQQSESRMLKEEVTADDIAGVVARWTGIPVTKLVSSEREKLLTWKMNCTGECSRSG